jgi:thiol-disulfide isomerase/thioredoxin
MLIPPIGFAAITFLGGKGLAETYDDPPPFQTTRHQFTLLRPSRDLPTVSLTNLKGRPARLSIVPGKVLLINIWATWCEACQRDLPLLERFHETIADRVEVVAVSVDKADFHHVSAYVEKIGVRQLTVLLDPDGRLAGSDAAGSAPLPLYGMPVTYLVTPLGRIAGYISGEVDWRTTDAGRLLTYYGGI